MFVALYVKCELPKRSMAYSQGVLPSIEAPVMNSNNWQEATNGQRTALHRSVINGIIIDTIQFSYLLASPSFRLVGLSSSLIKHSFLNGGFIASRSS